MQRFNPIVLLFLLAVHACEKDEKLKRKLSVGGKLDYRVMDRLMGLGYRDLIHESAKGSFVATVPTLLTQTLDNMNLDHDMRLDYILGKRVKVAGKCGVVQGTATEKLSDHYPIVCEVQNEK